MPDNDRRTLAAILGADPESSLRGIREGENMGEIAKLVAAMMGGRRKPLNEQMLPPGMHRYWWNGETVVAPQAPSRDHYRIAGSAQEYEQAMRAGEPPLFWAGEGSPTIEQANKAMQFYNENPDTAWMRREGVGAQAPYVWSERGPSWIGPGGGMR